MLDKAVYGVLFAGPAAVIWGYQNLLKLAGKDPQTSFPEGTWQFYVDYALREDTARHANEIHGFDTVLTQHQISLDLADRMTAWAIAALHCLHQYPDLLANEWRERALMTLLAKLAHNDPDLSPYTRLYREWQRQLPYKRGKDAAGGMRVSLRDFRPYVASLYAIGRQDLANHIAQDYLDGLRTRAERIRPRVATDRALEP